MIGQVGLVVVGHGAYEEMVKAWPSSDSPMGRLIIMHGLPEPQRFELVSATVYADGGIVQTLRPAESRA